MISDINETNRFKALNEILHKTPYQPKKYSSQTFYLISFDSKGNPKTLIFHSVLVRNTHKFQSPTISTCKIMGC